MCTVIKNTEPRPACAQYLGQDCDSCLVCVGNEEVVAFVSMAPVVQPECGEQSEMVS